MNEKLQYASMLDIPVNTCNVSVKPQKKRQSKRKRDDEQVKAQLLKKVNEEQECMAVEDGEEGLEQLSTPSENLPTAVVTNGSDKKAQKPKKKFAISTVGVQIALICILVATILVTNSIYPNSGINVFMRGIFGTEQTAEVDLRLHTEFSPTIYTENATLLDGVITINERGSVYSSCNGKVKNLTEQEDGKFTVEIEHSQNFISVFSGIDYAYLGVGDSVFSTIPVGFVKEGVSLCFTDANGNTLGDYVINGNTVVWAV